jgi:dTMP kinase
MSERKGILIVVDGPEGVGKTLQTGRLATEISALGHRVLQFREPGGTEEAEKVRHEIKTKSFDPPTELNLFLMARRSLFADVIKPELDLGTILIVDRSSPSTIAYQHNGNGIPLVDILDRDVAARGGIIPDLTIILDIPVSVGLSRIATRGQARDVFERKRQDFHARVREGYQGMSNVLSAWDIVTVDGNRKVEEVESDIRDQVSGTFPQLKL